MTGLDSRLAADLIEGVVKLGMLVGYIWLISHMNDVKRLFGYHGAEHKTINAYEAGAELTPENRRHVPDPASALRHGLFADGGLYLGAGAYPDRAPDGVIALVLARIGLIFPIAGIAYEIDPVHRQTPG